MFWKLSFPCFGCSGLLHGRSGLLISNVSKERIGFIFKNVGWLLYPCGPPSPLKKKRVRPFETSGTVLLVLSVTIQNTRHAVSTLWKAEISEWQIICTSLRKSPVFTWTFPSLQMLTELSMNVCEEDISLFLLKFFWEEQTAEISKNNFTPHTFRQTFCP